MNPAPMPAGFEDLSRFAEWALPTTAQRVTKRQGSTPEQLRDFYAGIMPRMEQVLEYLNTFPLEDIPEGSMPLFHIALSLAEVGPYVEWFDGRTTSRMARNSDATLRLVDEPAARR